MKLVVAMDIIKAFDSVTWNYFWATIEKMGFSLQFLSWVQLLHTSPKARVRPTHFPHSDLP